LGEFLASSGDDLPPQEVVSIGKDIYSCGKQLERLIENFLIYAQIELLRSDPQKTVALNQAHTSRASQIIEREAIRVARLMNREPDLALDLADAGLAISEDYLSKLVSELVSNALKFSGPGTLVDVRLKPAGPSASLVIQDRGCGLSPEHLKKVGAYMQFERKMHEQQGQGLGLAIAKGLAELHRGVLVIESVVGAGTTVTVRLPQAA
jgi:signal transduction histidine kinase